MAIVLNPVGTVSFKMGECTGPRVTYATSYYRYNLMFVSSKSTKHVKLPCCSGRKVACKYMTAFTHGDILCVFLEVSSVTVFCTYI